MALILKDNDELYIGFFQELENNKCKFTITNLVEFYSEEISIEELVNRLTENLNADVTLSEKRILKTLKTQHESCAITKNGDEWTVNLEYSINVMSTPVTWEAEFYVKKSCLDMSKSFIAQLMKNAIDNNSKIEKMKQALEAKDEEIEEYKRNGGTLVRRKLATEKFNFDELQQIEKVRIRHSDFQAITILISDGKLEDLCQLIDGEVVTQVQSVQIKVDRPKVVTRGQKKAVPVLPKFMKKVDMKYEDEDSESIKNDEVPSTSRSKRKSTEKIQNDGGKTKKSKKPLPF